MSFDWAQLIRTTTGRRSTASKKSKAESQAEDPEISDSNPLTRDDAIVSAIRQTPACLLTPIQFFVSISGVLALAFAGFPDPIVSMKEQLTQISNGLVSMAIEQPNSYWPMVYLGALTSNDRQLTLDQLESLTTMSKKISFRLNKLAEKIIISEISYVIFSSRSLEKIVFRADIPLHASSFGGSTDDNENETAAAVEFIPDDQKSAVQQSLLASEQIKVYIKEVSKPGYRSQWFRSYCQETTLAVFVAKYLSLIEVISEYRNAVDKLLPGYYNWFENDALHFVIRNVR
ncbi:hypothetical protein HK100_009564 [Physocladia obscura]|uniref:Uncharacterized protein n=1 Tax=Physocladia obscura TaxID=109957 RepID=A0AAD5XE61_9FUNG|nr:hypothetical protein HK100_009564 [Physocladia obscura]